MTLDDVNKRLRDAFLGWFPNAQWNYPSYDGACWSADVELPRDARIGRGAVERIAAGLGDATFAFSWTDRGIACHVIWWAQ
jgi:hypothetical protein